MSRKQIIEFLKTALKDEGVTEAHLFGSFARNERRYHDIDIAIKPPRGKFSLLDLVRLENNLQELTGKKVEIVTLRAINPRLKPYIKKDLVRLI